MYGGFFGVGGVGLFFDQATRRLYSSSHRIQGHRCDTIVNVGPVMTHPMLRYIATVLRGI